MNSIFHYIYTYTDIRHEHAYNSSKNFSKYRTIELQNNKTEKIYQYTFYSSNVHIEQYNLTKLFRFSSFNEKLKPNA